MSKPKLNDYIFEYHHGMDEPMYNAIPRGFKESNEEAFRRGYIADGMRDIKTPKDYAISWAYEIVSDLMDDSFSHCIDILPTYQIEFEEFTEEEKAKWIQIWFEVNTDTGDDWDPDIDHILSDMGDTPEEGIEKLKEVALYNYWFINLCKELPEADGMESIFDLYTKYRKEAHEAQPVINGQTYEQWHERIIKWREDIKRYEEGDDDDVDYNAWIGQ